MPAIQYLTYHQIDKKKWDDCIDNAENGLIYGSSSYLDCMAKYWDALVLGDYAAVMPLTWNKKYSVCYLYQPPFTASLGVFGKAITPALLQDFLNAIPKKFKYWDISLNHGNFFPVPGFDLYERLNFVLPLNADMETIYSNYRDNIKRNIKRSEQLKETVRKNIDVAEVILLAKEQLRHFKMPTQKDLERFTELFTILYQKEKAITYGIYTAAGKLVASAVFFFSHARAYYILVGNHPDGKTSGASHALINAFIKDHAGQDLILDFEGSDIRNLAFFYSSFGAKEEKYPAIRLNRLPFYMKWLKK